MAQAYCIPKQYAERLVNAIRDGDNQIGNIEQLYLMTSQERKKAFSKYVGQDVAKDINTAFEKAMVSNQKTALTNWVQDTFTTDAKKNGHAKSALQKIQELDEQGLLTPENMDQFLEDLVAEKLGVAVTAEEAGQIAEKTRNLQQASEKTNELGLPSLDYWQKQKDLDDYVASLTPTPALKVFTSIIGRGSMLFSVKSPLLNIESNTINAVTEGLARRIENLRSNNLLPGIGNATNKKAIAYMKYANEVFLKTGYDITRMQTLNDAHRKIGEDTITSEGKGITRKLGRIYTDIVFNKLMTAPDVAFASMHFADSALIKAQIIAKTEGLKGDAYTKRVDELFSDALKLDPATDQGRSVRDKAILEAERGTYTNKNNYSKVALGMRKILNDFSSDLRLGDMVMPFVQVPATVVGTTVDYSGVLMPAEIVIRTKNALNAKSKGDPDAFKNTFDRTFWRKATRAGIGLTLAFVMSSWFKAEDFIGEYPTTEKERKLLELEDAPTNAVRVGNKWISLDFLGSLGAPFLGMMYAKKYGKDSLDAVLQGSRGVGIQTMRTPGFRQFYDIYNTLKDLDPSKNANTDDLKETATNFLVDYFRSRTVPAIVSDVAKATDTYERETSTALDRFISSFPGVRQKMLQEKLNVFGEKKEGEGFWSTILAGSRFKTRNDDQVVEELYRLNQRGQLPAITDVAKTSSRAKELKDQIGESKFRDFYQDFGKSFKLGIADLLQDNDYQASSDEEKKDMIDSLKKELFNEALDDYGYEPKEDQ